MGDRPGERPLGLQAWTGLCAVVDRVRVLVNRDLQAEVGLTLAENLVLCQVAMAPGSRLHMVEIADRLGVAKSAVTKTVDRLEARGLLVRQRDPGDRRTVYAALSPAGHEVFTTAQPAFVDAVERHFATQVDHDTLATLARLPTRITPTEGEQTGKRHDPAAPTVTGTPRRLDGSPAPARRGRGRSPGAGPASADRKSTRRAGK